MKERPILFSGPMVRSILGGSKTVTRRTNGLDEINLNMPSIYQLLSIGELNCKESRDHGQYGALFKHGEYSMFVKSPYGRPGDRLWVRESWRVGKPHDKIKPVDILPSVVAKGQGVTVLYDAGGWKSIGPAGREEPVYPDNQPMPDWAGKGRPSIHMPRAFCRILLEVTDIRVERLQAISYEQAMAEGIGHAGDGLFHVEDSRHLAADPRESFASLWQSINGEESWSANPWVWCVNFKRVEVANVHQ